MSSKSRHPLVVAITVALGLATLAPLVHADPQPQSQREERAQRRAQGKKQAEQAKPALYPNATRKSPETHSSPKALKLLQEMSTLFDKEQWATLIAKAEEVAGMEKANAYDKSFAYSMAGNAAASMDDQAKAEHYFQLAIDSDGLDNDSHFSTMYNLVAVRYGEEKYAEALTTLDRFLAESKTDKPDQLSLRGGILAAMDRFDEAAAVYKGLLAKSPDDKRLMMNAVSVLQSGEKYEEANALLADAYKRGMLTEQRELRALYVGYMNAERWAEAQAVIEDGLAKGILKENADLSRDYQILAQNAYMDDKIPLAIELYKRAAPMAADGEAYLNLAKVLDYAERNAEAKAAAKQALEKGVKKPEEAKRILAR